MNPIHILLVEDSQLAQAVMISNLIKHGCTVDTATDAEAALEKAYDQHYDVILMDIGLGNGPDGFDVATLIKNKSALNKKTSIVAISATDEPEFRDKAKEIGMVGYFNKPFTQKHAEKIVDFIKNDHLYRIVSHIK